MGHGIPVVWSIFEECYRRFTREMVVYGRWTPPKLVCKEIKKEMTMVKVIPRMSPARRVGNLPGGAGICLNTVVSGRLMSSGD
jgi:hypothetical protein